jgi:hypothetical protein
MDVHWMFVWFPKTKCLTRDDTNVLYECYHYDQEKLVAAEIDVINKEIEWVYVNKWNSVYVHVFKKQCHLIDYNSN